MAITAVLFDERPEGLRPVLELVDRARRSAGHPVGDATGAH
ncbi:hypothetical protein AB0K02_12375 [Streptomyces sp. NPDC049597]